MQIIPFNLGLMPYQSIGVFHVKPEAVTGSGQRRVIIYLVPVWRSTNK